MIYFNKLFKFPGPKELGMSDNDNAMPSRMFPNKPNEVSWEDYYEYLEKTYPVKFFLASTLPHFFLDLWRKMYRPFKTLYYWVVSHLLPSRRFHFVDIRQPGPNGYRYGWLDTDTRMVYALFNLLKEFVEKESPHGYFVPSEEDAAKDDGTNCEYAGFKRQLDDYKEYMAIYNWWTKERQAELEQEANKAIEWHDARLEWAGDHQQLWQELKALQDRNEAKLEDMLHRLIKIRHCLWT